MFDLKKKSFKGFQLARMYTSFNVLFQIFILRAIEPYNTEYTIYIVHNSTSVRDTCLIFA